MKLYKLYIKNQTGKKIDLCVGLNGEFTLPPEGEMTVGIQDGDYFYIDQVVD
jgi:hypothetical protein